MKFSNTTIKLASPLKSVPKFSASIYINAFLLITILLFSGSTAFAQQLTFTTVTEAVNYTGADKITATKITITGQINGTDYSETSEWSKFRTLNETFPTIEEIEILTDQAIPMADSSANGTLFSNLFTNTNNTWLKKFSAPNVTSIGYGAFSYCSNLIAQSFGTDFTTLTQIYFKGEVFENTETKNIDLTLGASVFPRPDLTSKTWNGYTWKSITIEGFSDEVLLIVAASSQMAGTTDGSGIYNIGDIVTIEAIPNADYEFVNWKYNDEIFSTENPLQVTLTSDMFLTAHFKQILPDYGDLPIIDSISTITKLSSGDYLSLSVFAKGTNLNYQWYKNDIELNGATGIKYEKANITPFDAGNYTCKVWNTKGSVISAPVVVKLNSETTSIIENNSISNIQISPNPVSTESHIEIYSIENQPNTTISIVDFSGREIANIYSGTLNAGTTNFPISANLTNGSYLLLIKNDNGQKTKSFVVAK